MFSYTRKILDIMTHGNITRSSAFAEMVATPSVFAGIDNFDSMCSVTQRKISKRKYHVYNRRTLKKTGSMHPRRRWSLWTIAVTLLCLTFQLPHFTTDSFQSHWCQTTTVFFSEPRTFEGTQQTFSRMKKFCISPVSVVTFSGGIDKVDYSLSFSE